MFSRGYDAFVSYSHNDQHLVKPLVDLLQLNGRRVFWDAISIRPGDAWAESIESALGRSKLVVVLWCCDTAGSEWVRHEIRMAEERRKKLVPVLLCGFPVSEPVGKSQWIDMSGTVRHQCATDHAACPVPPPEPEAPERTPMPAPRRRGVPWLVPLAASVLLAAGLAWMTLGTRGRVASPPVALPMPGPGRPETTAHSNNAVWVGTIVAAGIALRYVIGFLGGRRAAFDAHTERLVREGISRMSGLQPAEKPEQNE